jgi:DNA-binding NtrC family response regulator
VGRSVVSKSPSILISSSAAMQEVVATARKAGASQVPVLIQGESGTGKELIARLVYGVRSTGTFVPIDCASISPQLIESELFGHERGAFTGAVQSRPGLLHVANGGTAFFDEIGELPLESQTKLLRCLQQKEIRSVGTNSTVPCNFRVISATNRDLAAEVRQGRFRLDLYYRLNVIVLQIPPLRERKEDIPELVSQFLKTEGGKHKASSSLMADLCAHHWPGNVRELENCVSRLVALTSDDTLHAEHLPRWSSFQGSTVTDGHIPEPSSPQSADQRSLTLASAESIAIKRALDTCGGRIGAAARVLGIGRTTMYRRLRRYELNAGGATALYS